MKRIQLFLLLLFIFPFYSMASEGTLEIAWKFLNVLNDYDHLNKIEVYIDGTLISTSEPFHESQLAKHIVKVPKGKHLITIKDFAYYNENWEEHRVERNYSINAAFNEEYAFKKKNFLTLVWDIDKTGKDALNYAWTKPNHKLLNESKPDKSDISLSVSWRFTNVKHGFDHDTRIVIYADGKKVFTSPVAKGATGNSFKANLPKNTSEIKLVAEAFYEGTWEEHLVVHEYSLDAVVLKSGPFAQKLDLDINFDLKNATVVTVWK
jgi:hypothetical protein